MPQFPKPENCLANSQDFNSVDFLAWKALLYR